MPAAKSNPLKKIRQQSAARGRLLAPASAGSAFASLSRQNEKVTSSTRRAYRDLDGNEQSVFNERPAKKARKTAQKTAKPIKPPPPKPQHPVIESWRPAGGEQGAVHGEALETGGLTNTLGLARLSTWRLPSFQEGVEKLLEQHGLDYDEMVMKEVIHGGESVTDVCVRFRSEIVAEMVRERIEGEMVEGRKLQVTFV